VLGQPHIPNSQRQADTVSFEIVPFWRGQLLASCRHEGLGRKSIELSKPGGYIGENWLEENPSADAPNSDAVPFESELAGKAHRLTSSILDELGSPRHDPPVWSSSGFPFGPCFKYRRKGS